MDKQLVGRVLVVLALVAAMSSMFHPSQPQTAEELRFEQLGGTGAAVVYFLMIVGGAWLWRQGKKEAAEKKEKVVNKK